ncbi:MAG: elongation factor G [Candidatus Bipolaricaulota bacterium]|nr:MAG: elongation factor G [Candidatus Bipolaricaulota bacterium]
MSSEHSAPIARLRNIGIMAHIDAGKTTATERILYYTGRTHRMGEVHDGDTEMDWMPQERERGITITSAATTCPWRDHQINIIDTPGHVDFTAEVERSLRVLDGAIVIFSGVEMVESQSEAVWRQADRYSVPRLAFVNKLDRAEASFTGTVEMIEERLGVAVAPLQLPYRDDERRLVGIVELLTRKLVVWDPESKGERFEELPVPDPLQDDVEEARETLIARVAEFDDRLMETYLAGHEVEPAVFHEALRRGCIDHGLIPVLGGSAFHNQGIQPLLEAVIRYLPSPLDVPPIHGVAEDQGERRADPAQPFAGLAFKVVTDRYAGRLVFVRAYSGRVKAGGHLLNSTSGKGLRLMKVFRMHANDRTPLPEISAGDIVAIVGSQSIATGDTLCEKTAPIVLERISFPEPVVFVAVEPRTEAELGDLTDALDKLALEDPTFVVRFDEDVNQLIVSGMGELHLEVLMRRLREEYGITASVGRPHVAYHETIQEAIRVEETFDTPIGGRGQFARVALQIEPLGRGEGIRFATDVSDEEVPKAFRSAVEEGVCETLTSGPLAGYPLADIGTTLIGGSFHPVDSSELAFKAAAASAVHRAYEKGSFELLEPMMEGDVITPAEYLGEVLEDLARRRGEIRELQTRETAQIVVVTVPLAETFGYATQLRSSTQGRGTYSLLVKGYEVVPSGLKEEIIRRRGY